MNPIRALGYLYGRFVMLSWELGKYAAACEHNRLRQIEMQIAMQEQVNWAAMHATPMQEQDRSKIN